MSQNWNEGGGNWINVWKLESVIKKKCYYNPSLVGIGAVSVFDLEGLYIFKWNRPVEGQLTTNLIYIILLSRGTKLFLPENNNE